MKISLKSIRVFTLLLLVVSVCAVSFGQLSEDAVILTLRAQEGIKLDTALAAAIDSGLIAAWQSYDSLMLIGARASYVMSELVVKTTAAWSQPWRKGQLLTGEPYIDSLGTVYELAGVDTLPQNEFLLEFAHPLEMRRLDTLYRRQSGIQWAEPDYYMGDGDDIAFLRKRDTMSFVFSRGWGDCPAGCLHRFYWYVSVAYSHDSLVAQLEEERSSDAPQPYFYRWNIPEVYGMTMFPSVDSILSTMSSSPLWWMRRHAIEGGWRFFACPVPWCTADDTARWRSLRSELLARRTDVLAMLNTALTDSDSDVRASARNAIARISALNAEEEPPMSRNFSLSQNYPNPFNPTTRIEYDLPSASHVDLRVYNVLGEEVRSLVSGNLPPGHHVAEFDGSGLPSGVYFVRMDVDRAILMRKILLIR